MAILTGDDRRTAEAVAAMTLASLFVLGNSLRLHHVRPQLATAGAEGNAGTAASAH